MSSGAPAKDGITKADVKELFDILFKEQKTTKLRVEELNEMWDAFLKNTGDLMTEIYVFLTDLPGCDSRAGIDSLVGSIHQFALP